MCIQWAAGERKRVFPPLARVVDELWMEAAAVSEER